MDGHRQPTKSRRHQMKREVIVIALLFPLAGLADQSTRPSNVREKVTVDYFLESCSDIGGTAGGLIRYFDCDSYIYGVLDTYTEESQFIPIEKRACFPKTLTPAQVMDDAWHIDGKLGPKIAAPALIEMLTKKYPCK
jgi:hypothetical protein